jgi:hypothetical protein
MAVTINNVVFWDVTPCGSCKNHIQNENIQRTKNTLAIESDCRTLRRFNHYMWTEAIGWDILHGGRTLLQRCLFVFFRYGGYIMTDPFECFLPHIIIICSQRTTFASYC